MNVVQRDVNIANQTLSISPCLFPVYSPSLLHIHTSNYFVNILCSQTKNIFEIILSFLRAIFFLFFIAQYSMISCKWNHRIRDLVISRSLEPKMIYKMMKININPLSCTFVSICTLILLFRATTRFIESKCLPTLFTLVTRRPYCPGRPKELCFTTLSLAMETMGMRLSVVKQSFFGPSGQYGRLATRANYSTEKSRATFSTN